MTLLELREESGLSQKKAADIVGLPLRTYFRYEHEPSYQGNFKYKQIMSILQKYIKVDESNGILNLEDIVDSVTSIIENHNIEYCYLYGSYAKNIATRTSDVKLLISNSPKGLALIALQEKLNLSLHKKVSLLIIDDAIQNPNLVKTILKDGIRIFAR